MSQPLCNDFKTHKLKHIRFCETCADKKCEVASNLLFCAMCNRQMYTNHKQHKPFLTTTQLKQKLDIFKKHLKRVIDQFKQKSEIKSQTANNIYKMDENILQHLQNQSLKKWIVFVSFWDFSYNKKLDEAIQNLKKKLKITQAIKGGTIISQNLIDWSVIFGQGQQSSFSNLLKKSQQQRFDIDKKKNIIQQLISVYSSYTNQQKQQTLQKIQKLIEQYPNQCLLYLSKIQIIQLHSLNYQNQWKSIITKLCQINSQLKGSCLIAFLQSHKFWKLLTKQQAEKSTKIKFVDTLSGHIFELVEPSRYIDILSKAMKGKGQQLPLIMKAARGLGYLAQPKYSLAITDFDDVTKISPQQSFCNNLFYAKLKDKQINTHSTQFLREVFLNLQQKSKHYIINMIKLLKKQNYPKEVIKCCQILEKQQNDNTFAKIQMVKAYIKLGQIQKAQQINQKYLQSKISDTLKQRIKRKKMYAQSKLFASQKNYEKTLQICTKLAQQKKNSGTAHYNMACMYYNQENWQKSLQCINKAIKLKNKEKYRKLRVYIYMMEKEIDKAKQELKEVKTIEIDQKIKTFLNEN